MIRLRIIELAVFATLVSWASSLLGNYRVGAYMGLVGMAAALLGAYLEWKGRRG